MFGNHLKIKKLTIRITCFLLVALLLALIIKTRAYRGEHLSKVQETIADLQVLATQPLLQARNSILLPNHLKVAQEIIDQEAYDQREILAQNFWQIMQQNPEFNHLTIIDREGIEKVHLEQGQGGAQFVIPNELFTHKNNYYFSDTLKLEAGHVYISPLDLETLPDGTIKQPPQPTIRVATPVVDSQNNKVGMLMVSVSLRNLFDQFVQAQVDYPFGKIYFLNSDGYWLYTTEKDREWGFLYPEREGEVFQNYYELIWPQIHAKGTGLSLASSGVFTYGTVFPLGADTESTNTYFQNNLSTKEFYWIIVIHNTPELFVGGYYHFILKPYLYLALLIAALSSFVLVINQWHFTQQQNQRKDQAFAKSPHTSA
jgi:hypothetical protein